MRRMMPSIAGITWARLEQESAVTYPCEHEGDPGERVVFTEEFPTATGTGRFVPAQIIPAAERPDTEYPFVLLLRSRGESADQPGARSFRQDSGVQVLRGTGQRRRHRGPGSGLCASDRG